MEDLIKQFLLVEPIGSGSGSGYGYGSGSGYGYGSGSGSGSGDGYGSGSGDGSGSGSGSGSGDGSGSGSGDGYGSGDGSGSGSGSGDGDGDFKEPHIAEYRKGYLNKEIHSFKSFNGKPIYYIDDIPCVFLSIKGNMAKVLVIKDDMSTQKVYIAKSGNFYAHGETKDEAIEDVQGKYFSSLSFDDKKNEFIKIFKKDEVYSNQLFFEWHHHLTGSCKSGRLMFVQSHVISLDESMTTLQFLNLTRTEYNGSIITDILSELS